MSLKALFALRNTPIDPNPPTDAVKGRTRERLLAEYQLWRALHCINSQSGGPWFGIMCMKKLSRFDEYAKLNPYMTVATKFDNSYPSRRGFAIQGHALELSEPQVMPEGTDPEYWNFCREYHLAEAHFLKAEWITCHMFHKKGSALKVQKLVERLIDVFTIQSHKIEQAAMAVLAHLDETGEQDLAARIRTRFDEVMKAVDADSLPKKPVLREFPTRTDHFLDMYSYFYADTQGKKAAPQRLFEAKTLEVLRWMVSDGTTTYYDYQGRTINNCISVQCALAPRTFNDMTDQERTASGVVRLHHVAIDLQDGRTEDALVGAFIAGEGLHQAAIKLVEAMRCLDMPHDDATNEFDRLAAERSWVNAR